MEVLKATDKLKSQLGYITTIGLVLFVFLINGCGINSTSAELKSNSFINRVNEEKHSLNPKDDAKLLKSFSLNNLPIVKSSGEKVVVDFSQQPVIFVAFWCTGCQRELVLLNKNKEKFDKLPIIICTGFKKNASLNKAVKVIEQVFNELEIQGFTTYYLMTNPSKKEIPKYPTVIYPNNNSIFRLTGEHTIDVFIRAFSN